jgi:RNA polymerase sigma-70 factor, ECF subfamily
VRGDLLAKLGRADEARAEFDRAAALTRNGG